MFAQRILKNLSYLWIRNVKQAVSKASNGSVHLEVLHTDILCSKFGSSMHTYVQSALHDLWMGS